MPTIEHVIESAWDRRAELNADEIEASLRPAVEQALDGLENGTSRVAERTVDGSWLVHQWLKKAVLLYFRINGNVVMHGGAMNAWD